ncbi:MAG: BON domain-containing protein [Firmicutes bacterium]|nr:BON domain-containing protein [Bacillota bacterium]
MSPIDRDPRPETQWDAHRPKGHPRAREAKFQKAQLESELRFGELKEVKRPMGSKLTSMKSDNVRKNDGAIDPSVLAQQALNSDVNLSSYDLSVNVTADGIARVTGIVDSLAEKRLVSDILSRVAGINQIENGVSISTDGRITDDDVLMEVSEEIALDTRVKSLPDIRVERGHVTLAGTVDSEEERQAMIEAASKARGVTEITDNLRVDDGEIDWDDPDAVFNSQVRNDRSQESGDRS